MLVSSLCFVLGLAQGPAVAHSPELWIARLEAALAEIGAPLEVVDVIEGVEGRYGAFGDLDGDGDLDYAATEMSHRREELALFVRGSEDRWRRSSVRSKPFQSRHPLVPWILGDDGSGHPAVVLPTGWPPYFYVIPTDGQGRFRGKPIEFEEALPARRYESEGVDDCPYRITELYSAGANHAARIHGELDEAGRGSAPPLYAQWEVRLESKGPQGRSMRTPDPGKRIDWARLPRTITPVEQPGCEHPEHDSPTRRSIMGSRLIDLNGDGMRDLVHFTGDFAAHVFLGERDEETGDLFFDEELPGAEPLPIEDAWYWFFDRMESFDDSGGYATNATEVLQKLSFHIDTRDSGDAQIVMYGDRRKSWFVEYYWTGEKLIPLIWYRSANPRAIYADQDGWFQGEREQLVEDWNGDGALDTLLVAPFHAMRWKGERPEQGGGITFIVEGEDFEFMEKHRFALVYQAGATRLGQTTLGFAPKADEVPEDRHMGYPIELASVPVFRGDKIVEERVALLVRDWNLAVFLAPKKRTPSRGALFRKWLRRGEQAFVQDRYFLECDARLLNQSDAACVPSGEATPRGHQRALWFFEKALELAQTHGQRADTLHRIARCHSRLHDLGKALRAYSDYVEVANSIEPLNSAHSDLTWLFSQPRFRDWHAWRRSKFEIRKRNDVDPPGRE